MFVPVFYLRQHIYLLLQHARVYIDGCAELITEREFAIPLAEPEILLYKKHPYITRQYEIVKDKIGETWKVIHNYWVAADTDIAGFKTRVAPKSRLQTHLYSHLLAWDREVKNQHHYVGAADIALEFAEAVCKLGALAHHKLTKRSAGEYPQYLNDFIRKLKSGQPSTDSSEAALKVTNFWHANPVSGNDFPVVLHNSHWVCYERTDGKSADAAQWGIALSSLSIKQPGPGGHIPVSLHSKYVSGETHYWGVISAVEVESKGSYLIAQFLRDSKPATPAFFAMKLKLLLPLDDKLLLVGHFLHYSVHYGHYITKTVLWEKVAGPRQPQDLTPGDSGFAAISENIRTFLSNRLRNRLTMPSKDVLTDNDADRYSLKRWLIKYNKHIIKNQTLLAYVGDYFICYYHGITAPSPPLTPAAIAASLRVDRLQITYDQDAIEFKAEYTHRRGDVAEATYRGIARYDTATIQLVLNECKEDFENSDALTQKNAQANFVHITVATPLAQPVAVSEAIKGYAYFPGIVSGLNDEYNTPVSFRMALVKREKLMDNATWERNQVFVPTNHLTHPVLEDVIKYFIENVGSLSIRIKLKNG